MAKIDSLKSEPGWPLVSIIIVNWNGKALLQLSLPPLFRTDYPNFEVIVVDNGSTDGSADFVTENFPARLLLNSRNLGFAGGNNVGLAAAQGALCVLLNNDVTVPPGWLTPLVQALLADPAAGIAGCKILFPDGHTLQHAGGRLSHPLAYSHHQGWQEADQGQFDQPREVEYVTGAAFALKTELLAKVGSLDEGYFPGYYEEIDYCRRAGRQGYRTLYVPGSVVVHHESATFKQVTGLRLYSFHKNRLRFVLKHYGPAEFFDEFVPAEAERAGALEAVEEIRATRQAYLNAMLILPELIRSYGQPERLADYQQALEQLEATVSRRRTALYDFQAGSWPREALLAHHALTETTFASDKPLIGPWLAAFRQAWNNVATKWYVRPLIRQQTTFNHLVGQSFDEQARFLHGLNELDQGHSGAVNLLIQHFLQLEARFEQLAGDVRQELAELRQQLDRIEQRLAASQPQDKSVESND